VHARDRLRLEHLQLLLQPLLRTGAARGQRTDLLLSECAVRLSLYRSLALARWLALSLSLTLFLNEWCVAHPLSIYLVRSVSPPTLSLSLSLSQLGLQCCSGARKELQALRLDAAPSP